MSNVRFIADLHWNHTNLIKVLREFDSVDEHNNLIRDNWNRVVNKKDTTYILGDVTMEDKDYSFLDTLNGRKYVVAGNHEDIRRSKELIKHVDGIGGMVKYKSKKHGSFWLTHCPIHPTELEFKTQYNIHGHIHNGYFINDYRYICVCAERIDYTPKTLDELLIKIE